MDFHVQQLKKCQIMQGCAKNNADVHNWQGLSDGSIPKKNDIPYLFLQLLKPMTSNLV